MTLNSRLRRDVFYVDIGEEFAYPDKKLELEIKQLVKAYIAISRLPARASIKALIEELAKSAASNTEDQGGEIKRSE